MATKNPPEEDRGPPPALAKGQGVVAGAALDGFGAPPLHIFEEVGVAMVQGELLGWWLGQLFDLVQHPLERNVAQLHVGLLPCFPAATHVAVVAGKPDLLHVVRLRVLDAALVVIAEEGGLELEAALVDRHGVADVGGAGSVDGKVGLLAERHFERGHRVDGVEEAQKVDLHAEAAEGVLEVFHELAALSQRLEVAAAALLVVLVGPVGKGYLRGYTVSAAAAAVALKAQGKDGTRRHPVQHHAVSNNATSRLQSR